MRFEKKTSSSKVEQGQALDSYLATLLASSIEPVFSDCLEKLVVVPFRKNDNEIINQTAQERSMVEPSAVTEVLDRVKKESCESNNNAADQWSRRRFDAQLFTVGGLTLATPQAEIVDTLDFPENLETLANQPDWCLGLLRHKAREIIIVDADKLIRKRDSRYKAPQGRQCFHNIVVLKGGKLGFVCDEIGEIRSIKPAEVKWRANKENRPWLIGMHSSSTLALVDLSKLIPVRSEQASLG